MIFYFSSTGNTRWAVKRLAGITGEKTAFIPDLLAGEKACVCELAAGEPLGFAFPVHGWRPPKIVREFIKRLHINLADGKTPVSPYTYALFTAGDDVGLTLDYLLSAMRENASFADHGITKLDSVFSLLMPETYVGLPFMDVDNDVNEKRKITESSERIKHIAEVINNRVTGVRELDESHFPWINSVVLGAFFEHFLVTDKPFHVVENRCLRCGICAASCPVDNIEWNKGVLPQWKHSGRCLACFNCYHHCPEHAVEYGRRTKNKGQYFFGRKNRKIKSQ